MRLPVNQAPDDERQTFVAKSAEYELPNPPYWVIDIGDAKPNEGPTVGRSTAGPWPIACALVMPSGVPTSTGPAGGATPLVDAQFAATSPAPAFDEALDGSTQEKFRVLGVAAGVVGPDVVAPEPAIDPGRLGDWTAAVALVARVGPWVLVAPTSATVPADNVATVAAMPNTSEPRGTFDATLSAVWTGWLVATWVAMRSPDPNRPALESRPVSREESALTPAGTPSSALTAERKPDVVLRSWPLERETRARALASVMLRTSATSAYGKTHQLAHDEGGPLTLGKIPDGLVQRRLR